MSASSATRRERRARTRRRRERERRRRERRRTGQRRREHHLRRHHARSGPRNPSPMHACGLGPPPHPPRDAPPRAPSSAPHRGDRRRWWLRTPGSPQRPAGSLGLRTLRSPRAVAAAAAQPRRRACCRFERLLPGSTQRRRRQPQRCRLSGAAGARPHRGPSGARRMPAARARGTGLGVPR